MGMPWPSPENPRCAERGCPFPVAKGRRICSHHENMFNVSDDALDDALIGELPLSEITGALLFLAGQREFPFITNERTFAPHDAPTCSRVSYILRHARGWDEVGLCLHCGGPRDRETKLCTGCLEKKKAVYYWRAERGLCVGCGRKLDVPDRKNCSRCLSRFKKIIELRRNTGMCISCGRNPREDTSVCKACREKNRQSHRRYKRGRRWQNRRISTAYRSAAVQHQRRYRKKKRELGLCLDCNNQASDRCQLCVDCRRKERDRCRARRLKLRANGTCEKCGHNPSGTKSSLCDSCYLRHLELNRASKKRIRERARQ